MKCPDHMFQGKQGQTRCKSCPPCGSGGARKGCGGASVGYCSICSPGTFVDGGVCKECAAGRFTDSENADTCKQCEDGFQPLGGKSFCKEHTVCAAGQNVTAEPTATSDRMCLDCPADHYSVEENSLECSKCAPCSNGARELCGKSFEGFCAACKAGTWFDNTTMRCSKCDEGHWCQDGKSFECGGLNVFCPPGSATPTTVAVGHFSVP